MAQKVFKTGNSLAVTIPADFANSVGVRAGDKVQASQERTKARIVYQFSGAQQLPLDEVFFSKRKRKKKKA